MTENQNMRYELYKELRNLKEAREAYEFIMNEPENTQNTENGKTFTCLIRTGKPDGVYVVFDDRDSVLASEYDGEYNDIVKGIGIVEGEHALVVALHDANPSETPLLAKFVGESGHYIDNPLDAMNDWNGKENTERLKETGLNVAIHLDKGEWVPSAAELALIYKHKDEIDEALEKCSGDRLHDDWYWTSTETSATLAWNLDLNSGGLYASIKVSVSNDARPVSAFPETL